MPRQYSEEEKRLEKDQVIKIVQQADGEFTVTIPYSCRSISYRDMVRDGKTIWEIIGKGATLRTVRLPWPGMYK